MVEGITFVTSNKGKGIEVKKILSKVGVKVRVKSLNIPEPRTEDQVKIAKEKAKYAYEKLKVPVVVEDTGLYFEAYKNFPGPFSKYIFNAIGYEGIFRLLRGKNKGAYFLTVVAYYDGKRMKIFRGTCSGKIILKTKGKVDKTLPYDAIFVPTGSNRTFGEMSKEEKEVFSHRRKAFEKFAKWLKKGENDG